MCICSTHLDHNIVTGSSLLRFIHPALHHIVAHLHHVLNTHKHTGTSLQTSNESLLYNHLVSS